MKRSVTFAAIAALLYVAVAAHAQPPQVGEQYEITRSYETSQEANDGSSGSSSGRDALLERVVAVRQDGIELEYDLSRDPGAEDRTRHWQLPARVLRQPSGSMQLLNREELEARLHAWLTAAGLPRAACGRWYFTWNAFQVECDPESVLETIQEFDLRSADLREGASYHDAMSSGPGTLTRVADGPDGARFAVTMHVDPEAVRRGGAAADVAVGEIMRTPVTLEAALRNHARENVSGTIEVTFDGDAAGNAQRRTKVIRVLIDGPDGRSEIRTATETLERRPVPAAARP